MNNINCRINKDNNMPYLWDSELWFDFTAVMEYLLWAAVEKEKIINQGEFADDFCLAVEDEIQEAEEVIKRRMKLSDISGIKLHTAEFFKEFKLEPIEKFAVVLLGCAGADYEFNFVLSSEEKSKNVHSPTVEMILRLYSMIQTPDLKETALLIDVKGDFKLCIEHNALNKNRALNNESFQIKSALLSYLLGESFNFSYKQPNFKEPLPELLIYNDVLEKAVNVANNWNTEHKAIALYIYGMRKSGKKLLVSHLSEITGIPVLFINWDDVINMPEDKKEKFFDTISIKLRLEKGFMCLYGIPDFSEEKETSYSTVFSKLFDISSFTVVLGEGRYYFPVWLSQNFMSLELWDLSSTEKISVWSYYSSIYNADSDVDSNLNGNKYVMSVGEIENTFATAYLTSLSKNDICVKAEYITDAVKQRDAGKLGAYASLINGSFVWDDLIVDESVKRQMKYICNQIKYRNVVGEEWGFFEKTPYGRGVSVLFYGPPGTGKTMAVQIMAYELGLELYRIDLSKMVSKYIGETEKNISALFDKAKHMNVILFFDEADSLFAKRSEVKDSNDRNANAETAHLLQKIEEYDGMVILATNLVEQIDDAFRRRIKFMIPFRFPDESTRKELWHSLIPDKTPLDDGIDLDFFAKEFELSGSQIKEILLNAAYIAVSDNKPLGNEQIKEAITWNYIKYGKQLTKDDFGYLA